MSRQRVETGGRGEDFVAQRLEAQGYQLIARNWRVRGDEIDIVALQGNELVCVEVRVRTAVKSGNASESVDSRKLQRVMLAAERFVERHPEHDDRIWRVDLVAITVDGYGEPVSYEHFHDLTLE